MKVILSPRARDDLRQIQTYIAYDNVSAAARVASRIRGAVAMLQDHPELGQVYESGPERRLSVPSYPYCIYYDFDEPAGQVNILTIWHTSRLPPAFP
jgi:plasmid stabilization system protein ParE